MVFSQFTSDNSVPNPNKPRNLTLINQGTGCPSTCTLLLLVVFNEQKVIAASFSIFLINSNNNISVVYLTK